MAGHQGSSTRRDANELLAGVPQAERAEINTMLMGEVVSYNASKQKATVQPRMSMLIGDESVRAPELMEVPVMHSRSGGNISHRPLKKGDEVMLIASQRSLDQSASDASDSNNNQNRMHSMSDMVAVPASYSKPAELKQLPKDSAYTGTEDGKNGMTIADAKGSEGGKKITIASGSKPDAPSHDLNEQLKGVAARLAQAEHNLHGLFDVTSRLREIAQVSIPGLSALAPLLNKDPSGLAAIAGAIEGKAQAYLQQAVEQALAKFLNPNLAGLASLLGGGLENAIKLAQSQLDDLIANNPIINAFDDLQAEIDDILSGDLLNESAIGELDGLRAQVASLTASNPVISTILDLRSQVDSLLAQAGPALNFLDPQRRLVQGVTKSMRFGGP